MVLSKLSAIIVKRAVSENVALLVGYSIPLFNGGQVDHLTPYLLIAIIVFLFILAQDNDTKANTQLYRANTAEAGAQGQAKFANEQKNRADYQTHIANARWLAANSIAQQEADPKLSLLLAMEAISATRQYKEPVVPQADEALYRALASPVLKTTLSGHTDSARSAVFSPDNKYIVTASDDKTAKIWDAKSGQLRFTLSGHTDAVNSAAFSPDGKSVVTASNDGTARVYRVDLEELLQVAQERTSGRQLSKEERVQFGLDEQALPTPLPTGK